MSSIGDPPPQRSSPPVSRRPQRRHRWHALSTTLLVAGALLTIILTVPLSHSDALEAWWLIPLAVVALTLLIAALIRTIRHGSNIMRLINLMLVAVTAFTLAFYSIATGVPGEFDGISTRIDALYFTLTTMTTTGYGDITATGQTARVLVSLALLFDLVFLGLLGTELSRLLGRRAAATAEAAKSEAAASKHADSTSATHQAGAEQ